MKTHSTGRPSASTLDTTSIPNAYPQPPPYINVQQTGIFSTNLFHSLRPVLKFGGGCLVALGCVCNTPLVCSWDTAVVPSLGTVPRSPWSSRRAYGTCPLWRTVEQAQRDSWVAQKRWQTGWRERSEGKRNLTKKLYSKAGKRKPYEPICIFWVCS